MKQNVISVIIPVYNTAEYLPRCLDSVLNNTYRELEIICINDGSPDNALEILNDYAAKDSRIRVLDQKNAGVSAARNRGLDAATGEYIAFVDSDDWIHREYFQILLDGIREHAADVSVCWMHRLEVSFREDAVDASEKVFRPINLEQVIADSCARRRIYCKLYRASLIGAKRFEPDMRISEDTVFNLNVLCAREDIQVVLCQCRLYYYFIRTNSAVHTIKGRMLHPVARWYLDHAQNASGRVRAIFTEQALKVLYSWRYEVLLSHNRREHAQIRPMLEEAMLLLRSSSLFSSSKKLSYSILTAVPLSYRLFRLIKDPTLLYWESALRRERKASRK